MGVERAKEVEVEANRKCGALLAGRQQLFPIQLDLILSP